LEALEDRLAPAGSVLQTDIPLLSDHVYDNGGYQAAKMATDNFEDISKDPNATNAFQLQEASVATTSAKLGFNFQYFGTSYTSVWISTTGLMTFGNNAFGGGYADGNNTDLTQDAGPNQPLLAPLWGNWATTFSGTVYYETLGNAGNQRFVVEWDQISNANNYSTQNFNDNVTFEVALYEADGRIEFRYHNVVSSGQPDPSDNGAQATIGIRSGYPNPGDSAYGSGEGPVPDGVNGIQVGFDGGASQAAVVQNGQTIAFAPDGVAVYPPPTGLALSRSDVPENQPAGTAVGTFGTTCANPDATFTYSLVSSATGNDNNLFTISGDTLKTAASFDFEAHQQYTIDVQTSDQFGSTFVQQFIIDVDDVNEPPVVTPGQSFSVMEGSATGTVVGTVTATDPDTLQQPPTVLTWSIDAPGLRIDPATGQITVADPTALNATTAPTLTAFVTVTDNGTPALSDTESVVIHVTPRPRPTVSAGPQQTYTAPGLPFRRTISFNDPGGSGWSVFVNYDDGSSESFALTPGAHGYDDLRQTFVVQHTYTTVHVFNVTVTVTNSFGGSGMAFFPVAVYQAPEATQVTGFGISVVGADGTATTTASSPDGSEQLGATLSGAQPGDSVALATYAGDPTGGLGGGTLRTLDQGVLGSATGLFFGDARVRTAAPNATLALDFTYVVSAAQAAQGLQVYWFDPRTRLWETIDNAGATLTTSPLLDPSGKPTGTVQVHFTATLGPNSRPSLADLNGTVFALAIPAVPAGATGPGSGTSTAVLGVAREFASLSGGDVGEVEVETTGFGAGSQLTLTVQVSQSVQTVSSATDTRGSAHDGGGSEDAPASSGASWFVQWWPARPVGHDDQLTAPPTAPPPPAPSPDPASGGTPGHDEVPPFFKPLFGALSVTTADLVFAVPETPGLPDVPVNSAGDLGSADPLGFAAEIAALAVILPAGAWSLPTEREIALGDSGRRPRRRGRAVS
jgi:hypothetical protein